MKPGRHGRPNRDRRPHPCTGARPVVTVPALRAPWETRAGGRPHRDRRPPLFNRARGRSETVTGLVGVSCARCPVMEGQFTRGKVKAPGRRHPPRLGPGPLISSPCVVAETVQMARAWRRLPSGFTGRQGKQDDRQNKQGSHSIRLPIEHVALTNGFPGSRKGCRWPGPHVGAPVRK